MPPTGVSPPGSVDPPKVRELAVVRRFRAWRGRHTLVMDGLVALAVLGASLVFSVRGWSATALLVQVLCIAPIVWRRRSPFLVLWVAAATELLAVALEVRTPGFAPGFACYTVLVHDRARNAFVAIGVLLAVTVVRTLQWPVSGMLTQQIVNLVLINAIVALLGFAVRTRRAHLAELEERAARLEVERDQQAQLAAADERSRIAREMHDIVAHNLAMMISLADGATAAMREHPDRARVALDALSGAGRAALDELRRVLGVLRGDQLDTERSPQPVLADLESLIDRIRAAGMPVEFTVHGRVDRLPESAQLAVYRLVQEGLTNAMKHGGVGTSAEVRLDFAGSGLDLTVTNTGWSAPLGEPVDAWAGGHGLVGMRERVAVYGGTVHAGPRAGGGWEVHATIPANGSPVDSAGGPR